MKTKKGEMSLQVVVAAVIAILILVLLVWIVGSKLGLFDKAVSDCTGKGGHCAPEGGCNPGEQVNYLAKCPTDGNVCCISKDDLIEDITGQRQ